MYNYNVNSFSGEPHTPAGGFLTFLASGEEPTSKVAKVFKRFGQNPQTTVGSHPNLVSPQSRSAHTKPNQKPQFPKGNSF